MSPGAINNMSRNKVPTTLDTLSKKLPPTPTHAKLSPTPTLSKLPPTPTHSKLPPTPTRSKKLPPTPTTTKERYEVKPVDLRTHHSGTRKHIVSASIDTLDSEDDRSSTSVASPTYAEWSRKHDSPLPSPYSHETELELYGTALFDDVREQFRGGISTLDNLLRYMERSGPAQCKGYRRGILTLLSNLVSMAKWLVAFLESARTADDGDSSWTRSAVVGLRVDLHQYSWKVMKLTTLLKQVGVYDTPRLQL